MAQSFTLFHNTSPVERAFGLSLTDVRLLNFQNVEDQIRRIEPTTAEAAAWQAAAAVTGEAEARQQLLAYDIAQAQHPGCGGNHTLTA